MEMVILELLSTHGPLHGLELVVLSRGKLKRGLVYVWLDKMEDAGSIRSWMEPCNRRKYAITDEGKRQLIQHRINHNATCGGLIPLVY